ncbi:unnamed protein product [Allacma fusca]|uniref:glutathione transferase n=1 Tax=Allacma fusca TaxID=39272 RepID=A0A8J2J416_9HEXA|nr:unnamed protein product [Allacma fusca]
MAEKPVLGYWNIRGYTQATRFLLKYLKVDYEEKLYEFSPPPDYKKDWRENHQFSLGLDFPNLPYWIDEDVKMTESIPIFREVARKYGRGIFPNEEETLWKVEMVESLILDILRFFTYVLYRSDQLFELINEVQPEKFKVLENFFGNNPWVLGSQLSYLDFLLYEVLYQHTVLKSDIFQNFPRLQEHIKNFEAIPEISEYMKSSEFIASPVYTPVANYKI